MKIIVCDEHSFNTDTILLANFSLPKNREKSCDFGTGSGAIPLFWRVNEYKGETTSIEIQENACSMLNRTLKLNSLEDKIKVANCDIKSLCDKKTKPKNIEYGSYGLISCNPPYKKMGAGLKNTNISKTIARHEVNCSIDDITSAAQKMLKFSGRLCMCHRVERLCDVIVSMRLSGIEPKKLRFVQQRKNKQPKLFLIEGRKGANPGIITLPVLFIEDESGNLSQEILDIYGKYKSDHV